MTQATPSPSGPGSSTETASPSPWPRLNGQAVSDFLGFSPRWLKKLEDQSFVERGDDGLFDAGAVALGYIRWLKDDARRPTRTEGAKLKEAEQLRRLQIENAKLIGELVEFEMVQAFFAESHAHMRHVFGGIPAGLTRDPDLRDAIEKRLNAGFDEYRSRFEAMAAAVREQRPALDGDEEGEP